MHLVFSLFRYFPYGGLQRDFRKLAMEAMGRGHRVTALVMDWQGPRIAGVNLLEAKIRHWSRYRRYQLYADWVKEQVVILRPDCLVGFNKIPGLHVYYAADPCIREVAATQKFWLYRLLPRYRHFSGFEAAVLEVPEVHLLMLTLQQLSSFRRHYRLADERVTLLPPGICPNHCAPFDYEAQRQLVRKRLGVADDTVLLLAIGSSFFRKGLDRTLAALGGLAPSIRNQCLLRVLGEDRSVSFRRQARRLGITDRVEFLGGRDDVPSWMLAGDLLIHPAREEVAGMILLEAVVAGCPVLVSDVCGYAPLVIQAGAGVLLPSPFSVSHLSEQLARLIADGPGRKVMSERGRTRGREADWFSLPESALQAIEQCGRVGKADA